MSWTQLQQSLAEFDSIIGRIGVRLGEDAPISAHLEMIREFLSDRESMDQNHHLAKWNAVDFKQFYDSVIVVSRLTDAVVALRDQPEGTLRKRLRQVVSGSLIQDFAPHQAKDYFYELEIARLFIRAGFTVALREPDVVVSGNGLTRDLGMACKYPSSEAQLHEHFSKGYRQIANQDLDGCVVVGLDNIVFNTVFASIPRFLDFRPGDRHPLDVADALTMSAIQVLVQQRASDYPSERPIDGALLTLSVWGIWGQPAGFVGLTSWALQCDSANAVHEDLRRVVGAVRLLDSGDIALR